MNGSRRPAKKARVTAVEPAKNSAEKRVTVADNENDAEAIYGADDCV